MVDLGERVLKVQGAFTAAVTPDVFSASGGVTSVTFNREGFATTVNGFVSTTLTLTESTNNNHYTRCLQITAIGMMTTLTRTFNPATC